MSLPCLRRIKGFWDTYLFADGQLTFSKGLDACEFDILQTPDSKRVNFVVLSHILERIPDQSIAMRIVPKACHISKKLALTKQSFLTVTIIHSSTA